MVDNASLNNNGLSKESYFESFETFLQNLAPVKLSHNMENSGDPFQSTIVPRASFQGISSDLSCGGRGGCETEGASTDEVKRLQELVELLQVRLDALQRALDIQEQEVCREMGATGTLSDNSYEKLLTRWRREVCVMLLKQRVDALQFEQRQLQHTKKEHHLTVQLHEARALVEVLKQKERNSQAEIAILTTSTKVAEMKMREEGARRQHEMERTLKGAGKATIQAIAQIIKSHADGMSLQMERVTDALCRLDMHLRRLFFAEQQVAMAAGLISSNCIPQGALSFQKEDDPDPHVTRRKDCAMVDQQKTIDHIGRANQLEVLLAAAKTQLVEECLHAKELQERLVKSELEAREFTKRATKKLQEQADRDLASIKRQHDQVLLSFQQKVVKLQADQARGIVAQHQLERKMLQQQQEFTQSLSQKDVEFKKSLEAKELEVSNLLEEQNTLLVKLKKFWRPILNSSSAKVFQDQKSTAKNMLHLQEDNSIPEKLSEKVKPSKSLKGKRGHLSTSVETQTDEVIRGEIKVCNPTSSLNDSRYEEDEFPQDEELITLKMREKGSAFSRVSTPSRKNRQGSRLGKKTDDDLIASFLTKLQKSYVKSREISSDPFVATLHVDSSPPKFSPTTPHSEGDGHMEARHTPRSSVGSKESFEINDPRSENLAQYVICVPRREARNTSGNTFFLKTRRKKKVVSSNHFLRAKLENLEDLGESLLSRGHHHS